MNDLSEDDNPGGMCAFIILYVLFLMVVGVFCYAYFQT